MDLICNFSQELYLQLACVYILLRYCTSIKSHHFSLTSAAYKMMRVHEIYCELNLHSRNSRALPVLLLTLKIDSNVTAMFPQQNVSAKCADDKLNQYPARDMRDIRR